MDAVRAGLRGALVGALVGLVGAVLVTLLLVVSGSGGEEANVGLAYAPLFLLVLGASGISAGAALGALVGIVGSQLSAQRPTSLGRVLAAVAIALAGFAVGAFLGGTVTEAFTDDRDLASAGALVGALGVAALGAWLGWTRVQRR